MTPFKLYAADENNSDVYFDSNLLMGTKLGVSDLEKFNQPGSVEQGSYLVDIYVNDSFISRSNIDFKKITGDKVAMPCLSEELLNTLGLADSILKKIKGTANTGQCFQLEKNSDNVRVSFNQASLRLNISIPQALMNTGPRGQVDVAQLDAGNTMAFISYDANYFKLANRHSDYDSFYTGINAGMNVGLWHFRQQSAFTYTSSQAYSNKKFDNIRTYLMRPLPALKSQVSLGDNYTSSNLLSSVGYRGVHIESDERMLPDSMRGYAPVITGTANTNAKVVIKQNKNIIYQTTVSPGPFKIVDLYPTSYQGDLDVEVYEANGAIVNFTVPFAAVPDSLRTGMSRYSATAGKVGHINNINTYFSDLTYERGLSNALTGNGAVRISNNYQSVVGGLVFGTSLGAVGMNLALSNTKNINDKSIRGWRAAINYSHLIRATQTSFTFAGYRYSTRNYRDFIDAVSARQAYKDNEDYTSSSYQQRDQLSVNINQSLNNYGSLSLSASLNNYYGKKGKDKQLQLSYNNNYKYINYNLSVIRQKTGSVNNIVNSDDGYSSGYYAGNRSGKTENSFLLSFSIPLGGASGSSYLSNSLSKNDQGSTYQTSLSGLLDEEKTLSYGLSAARQSNDGSGNLSGNLQKNMSIATVGANYSHGDNYWQAGANGRGAAVIHAGGLTLGPYINDTFGVIEAKGAEGAAVVNGRGATIDRFGYAIIPSLLPYRYNDIALDTKGINKNAELVGNQVKVAPYSGSSVAIKFATITGYPLLVKSNFANGDMLPLGADVFDKKGNVIGVVGQGGQVYARAAARNGTLQVSWGKDVSDRCMIDYDIRKEAADKNLYKLTAVCQDTGRDHGN